MLSSEIAFIIPLVPNKTIQEYCKAGPLKKSYQEEHVVVGMTLEPPI